MVICQCCGQPIKAQRAPRKAPTFKGYADWSPAHTRAKMRACAELGASWKLIAGASVIATLPAAWVSCKVFGRTSRTPRDVRLPAARFWDAGMLPAGPDYGAEYSWETAPVTLAEAA